MSLKKAGFLLLLSLTLIPTYKIYAATNAGFVPENIWYSIDPFEEGDRIKIYTLIFNPDARALSGTVIFFDDNLMLGKKYFSVPAKGVKDISIDWTATVGTHNIFGKIENARFLVSAQKYEEVYLEENETSKSARIVAKKIIPEKSNSASATLSTSSALSLDSITNLGQTIIDKTPTSVTTPIVFTSKKIEQVRSNIGNFSNTKKLEAEKDVRNLDSRNKTTNKNPFVKPFTYVKLFFFKLLSLIFNNKIIFYPGLIFIVFILLRFLWRLFFK